MDKVHKMIDRLKEVDYMNPDEALNTLYSRKKRARDYTRFPNDKSKS